MLHTAFIEKLLRGVNWPGLGLYDFAPCLMNLSNAYALRLPQLFDCEARLVPELVHLYKKSRTTSSPDSQTGENQRIRDDE